jgi:hypothetical protein
MGEGGVTSDTSSSRMLMHSSSGSSTAVSMPVLKTHIQHGLCCFITPILFVFGLTKQY